MENKAQNRKAALLVAVVFFLGMILGGLVTHLWGERILRQYSERHHREEVVQKLTRTLDLTPDQQKQLGAILDDAWGKYHALHEKHRPEYEEVRHEARVHIRAILTPEQLPRFEDFVRRVDEERRNEESH
jgi:Spy/CpxP family protein refolding chaperone